MSHTNQWTYCFTISVSTKLQLAKIRSWLTSASKLMKLTQSRQRCRSSKVRAFTIWDRCRCSCFVSLNNLRNERSTWILRHLWKEKRLTDSSNQGVKLDKKTKSTNHLTKTTTNCCLIKESHLKLWYNHRVNCSRSRRARKGWVTMRIDIRTNWKS